jgi:hypothetical protein
MKKLFLTILLCIPSLFAATSPVYVSYTGSRCGMVKASSNSVQVWCWDGIVYTSTTAVFNVLLRVPTERSSCIADTRDATTTMRIFFTLVGTNITYRAELNNVIIARGLLE